MLRIITSYHPHSSWYTDMCADMFPSSSSTVVLRWHLRVVPDVINSKKDFSFLGVTPLWLDDDLALRFELPEDLKELDM